MLERINSTGGENADGDQRDERLAHEQRFGAAREYERVGGAEGGTRVEGQEQVIEELGHPVFACVLGVLLELRKAKVIAAVAAQPPAARPAAVDLPVPERKGEHVPAPDERRVAQQRRAGRPTAGKLGE